MKKQYVLKLFVAGATERSHLAVLRVHQICDAKLKRDYTLKVFDIFQQPKLAKANQIVATPTLIKDSPLPACRYIGIQAIINGLSSDLESLFGSEKRIRLPASK